MDLSRLLRAWHVLPMILVHLHQRKEPPRDSHTMFPSQDLRTLVQNLLSKCKQSQTACQDGKTNRIGKTEMAESLEPVAELKELAGIPSSEIQVLFFFFNARLMPLG